MKILFLPLLQALALPPIDDDPQPQPYDRDFASPAAAKAFFYDLDDQHNRAMIAHDSAFYAQHHAKSFINCDPFGAFTNKAGKIQNQLHARDWVSIEHIAPQFDVFAFDHDLTTLMVAKHTRFRTPAGIVDTYPRRTIVFQRLNGQVTYLKPTTVGR